MTHNFVLDASIAVKWFFLDEPHRDAALRVRDALIAAPANFAVPHLFFSELLHVLSRKSGADREFVSKGLNVVQRLGIRTLTLSDKGWHNTLECIDKGLGGYDATYVALAMELRWRWLTADEKALRKLPGVVLHIREFPPI
jgi:predicted nucleic acid-binding protein